MSSFGLYLAFLVPPLLFGLFVQSWLKRTFAEQSQVADTSGLSGAQVARRILDGNGLTDVEVQRAAGGPLSDHYDPRTRTVNLSEPVYDGTSVASTSVAAHETGHAIQHQHAYRPLAVRSVLFPAVAFASSTWTILLVFGAILGALGLVQVALILYAVVVLFQFVTLPVEFDASRRAGKQLGELGLVTAPEQQGVHKVLRAAALTYVAGALAALSQLAYFMLLFFGGNRG